MRISDWSSDVCSSDLISTLLSIKTGGCPEDCAYCPQSAQFDTGVEAEKLTDVDSTLEAARAAKANGASRFCMGAAWRSPTDRDIEKVGRMIAEVKEIGRAHVGTQFTKAPHVCGILTEKNIKQ